jgi:hypothetical protein
MGIMSVTSISDRPSFTAHIRRLSKDDKELYIRITRADLARLALNEGEVIAIEIGGRVRVRGIIGTAGSTPWLRPMPDSSNAAITFDLRGAGYGHGDDVDAILVSSSAPVPSRPSSPSVQEAIAPAVQSSSPAADKAGEKARSSFPFSDRTEILMLADRYWSLISQREADEERVFNLEVPGARQRGFLTKSLFVRLARWKSVRPTLEYESNDEANVRAATARAITATDDTTALHALMQLRGVALRTASAIAHWIRPDCPVIDVRVVAALGLPEPKSWENMGFCNEVANEIRAIAQRHSLDLRTVDRALWTWHKLQTD